MTELELLGRFWSYKFSMTSAVKIFKISLLTTKYPGFDHEIGKCESKALFRTFRFLPKSRWF